MYKINNSKFTNKPCSVNLPNQDGSTTSIPFDPANRDANEFAKWLKEGNKPEPAVEGEIVTDEWVAETIAKLLPNG